MITDTEVDLRSFFTSMITFHHFIYYIMRKLTLDMEDIIKVFDHQMNIHLRPIIENSQPPTLDTTIGPISLNFDELSCLEHEQV